MLKIMIPIFYFLFYRIWRIRSIKLDFEDFEIKFVPLLSYILLYESDFLLESVVINYSKVKGKKLDELYGIFGLV